MPVNKRDFNSSIKQKLINFIKALNNKNIYFTSKNFEDIKIERNSFVYADPPYLATVASYNENGGWNNEKEINLLNYLDELDSRSIKFALSNVFQNKGKTNEILKKWSKKYNIHPLMHSYNNCNYHAKDKSKCSTSEILITNY